MHTAEVQTNAFICSRYDSIITKKGMYPKLISRLISGKKKQRERRHAQFRNPTEGSYSRSR